MALGQLQPSGQPDVLGNFDYGAMVTRVSGVHGDTYHCNAANNVSVVSDTFILSGTANSYTTSRYGKMVI